jgi:hypothetical protein
MPAVKVGKLKTMGISGGEDGGAVLDQLASAADEWS